MKIVTVSEHREWEGRSPRTLFLFAYVRVTPPLARNVCMVRDALKAADPRQVYSRSSHLHVTVKVLGWLGKDVKRKDLGKVMRIIDRTAEEEPPFALGVDGVGVFPDAIYGRVGAGASEIRRINAKLVERLGDLAARGEYEGRLMVPHVTIAHFATSDVRPLLAKARELSAQPIGRMTVDSIEVRGSYPQRLLAKSPSNAFAGSRTRFRLGVR